MQRFKRFFLRFFSALGIFLSIYYAFLFFTLKPDLIRQSLQEKCEDITGANLAFQNFKFSVFPVPSGEMEKAILTFKGGQGGVLEAEKLKFSFHFLNFLFRKADLASLSISGGKSLVPVPSRSGGGAMNIANIRIKIWPIGPHMPIRIRFWGDYEDIPKSIRGEMILMTDRIEKWDAHSWSLKGNAELRDLPLEKIGAKFPALHALKKGKIKALLYFRKEHSDPRIYWTGQSSLHGVVYEIRNKAEVFSSPAIDASASWDLAYNPESEEISLKQASVNLPEGRLDFSGLAYPAIGEIKQARLSASGIRLEGIPQYYRPFKDAVPLNLGFSGKSNLDMSFEGTFNHLSLHAQCDLTPALLTYGRVFSKPKDVPMEISFDFLVRDGRTADGDFSFQLKNAGVKGTLRKLDFRTGAGELNLISNKFELTGWETLLPFFQGSTAVPGGGSAAVPAGGSTIAGEFKLLANFSGNLLQNPDKLKRMFNLTLDHGSFRKSDGSGISHLGFMLDYENTAIQLKRAELQIGDSLLSMAFSVYNPLESPVFKGQLSSARMYPLKVLAALESFQGSDWPGTWKAQLHSFKEGVAAVVHEGQAVDNFSVEIEQKDKKFSVPSMKFGIYQGTGQLQGDVDFSAPGGPQYQLKTEIDKLSLSQFYASRKNAEKIMDGNLFLTATMKGLGPLQEWKKNLEGEGLFSVTSGEFYGFDVMGKISKINGFSALETLASGKTSFDDLRARFSLKEGKITTPKVVLLSNNLSISAKGETSADGLLNYRLEAFLAAPLAARAFGESLKPPVGGSEDLKFGPVPMLLSGSLQGPELEPNPALLPDLQERIQKKKSQKVFQSFPAEDFFLARPKAS